MRYAAGEYLNALERALSVTMSPSADTLFPATSLYDGRPNRVAKFGSASAYSITADLTAFNGDFESWSGGAPVGWTVSTSGGGTVTETATVHGGAKAASLNGDVAQTSSVYRDFTVRAGERRYLDVWARINGSATAASVRLQNLVTGKYLQSDGTWGAIAAVLTTGAGAYTQLTKAYQVESFLLCQAHTVVLRVTLLGTYAGAGAALFDDVYDYPTINFASIHGHNIEPVQAPDLRSSTDNFAGNTVVEATFAVRRPSFHAYLSSAVNRRYWRITTGVTPRAAVYVGELVLGYMETAAKGQRPGWEIEHVESQVRNETRTGETYAYPLAQDDRRVARLPFRRTSDDMFREARDEIYRRCRGGQHPLVLVPVDAEDIVIHGRIDKSWKYARVTNTVWDDDFTVVESPFPSVTG